MLTLSLNFQLVFACASAETFALGSVALLDSLGFVDEICFGSEEGNLEILEKISSILNSNDYIKELEAKVKELNESINAKKSKIENLEQEVANTAKRLEEEINKSVLKKIFRK